MESLKKFFDYAHSTYHAIAYLAEELRAAGYSPLCEGETWELTPGGKYYVTRGGSAVMAFRVPQGGAKGFLLSASHADRPTFKVKENGVLVRHFTAPRICEYNRITIGTEDQMRTMVDILRDILKGEE